jgi:hypothetical protein
MATEQQRVANRERVRRQRERQRNGQPPRKVGRPKSGNGRPWKKPIPRCPMCGEIISIDKDCKCP